MKAKFSFFILALSLLFFSCGGGLSQEGTGSVSIDAGKVAEYLSRNAARSNNPGVSYKMTVRLSTIGDYETSAEGEYEEGIDITSGNYNNDAFYSLYKSAMGSPITIDDIPVGSRIKVKAEVYFSMHTDIESYKAWLREEGRELSDEMIEAMLADLKIEDVEETLVGEGVSDSFVVKSGPNKATIRMKGYGYGYGEFDEEIDIPIILYELQADGKNADIFSYENDEKTYIAYGIDDEQLKFLNYCTDGNYIYVYYTKADPDHGQCYYLHSNNPEFSDDVLISSNSGPVYESIAYDPVGKKIYTYYKYSDVDSADLRIICFPKLVSEGSVDDSVTYTSSNFFSSGADSGGVFAVNNQTAYVAKRFRDANGASISSLGINEFDLSGSTTLGEGTYITDLCTACDDIKEITDTYYEDGNLYILVKKDQDAAKVANVFGGGILRLNISSKSITPYLFSEDKSFTIRADTEVTFTFPQPASSESKDSFFCPKKIIGIKPKKLIIADDGVFLDTDYEGNPIYNNVNRIVTVNLDAYPNPIKITSVLPIDVNFEGDKTDPLGISTLYGEGLYFSCDD